MPTPREGYYLKDGTRVPSVTTILGRYKDAGGLINWSWKLAYDPLQQAVALLKNYDAERAAIFLASNPLVRADYNAVRESAADAGTLAHAAVEAHIKEQAARVATASKSQLKRLRHSPPNWPELIKALDRPADEETIARAKNAFESFLNWAGQSNLIVTHTEIRLVSEAHRFGGTPDAMFIHGKRALGDWKTSNSIYAEYLMQIAAYGILWEEHYPDDPITGGYHLLRFDKTYADFTHKHWNELETAKIAFLKLREAYELEKELKKRAS